MKRTELSEEHQACFVPCEIIATESQLLFLFHKIKYLARSKYQYLECYFFFIKEHMESQIIAESSPPPLVLSSLRGVVTVVLE